MCLIAVEEDVLTAGCNYPLLGCLKCGQPAFSWVSSAHASGWCFISEWAACVFVLFLIAPSDSLLQQPAVFIHTRFHLPPKSDLDFPPFSSSLKAAHVNQVGVLPNLRHPPHPWAGSWPACRPSRTALRVGLGGKGLLRGAFQLLLLIHPGHPEPWSYCNSSANLVSCT